MTLAVSSWHKTSQVSWLITKTTLSIEVCLLGPSLHPWGSSRPEEFWTRWALMCLYIPLDCTTPTLKWCKLNWVMFVVPTAVQWEGFVYFWHWQQAELCNSIFRTVHMSGTVQDKRNAILALKGMNFFLIKHMIKWGWTKLTREI